MECYGNGSHETSSNWTCPLHNTLNGATEECRTCIAQLWDFITPPETPQGVSLLDMWDDDAQLLFVDSLPALESIGATQSLESTGVVEQDGSMMLSTGTTDQQEE